MSLRTAIIAALIDTLQQHTASRGYRGLRFIHELNTFPCFCVHAQSETRSYESDNARLALMSVAIRGYCWTDSLDEVEAFARQLEQGVAVFASSPLIQEARVTSLRTDEGLLEPYSAIDIDAQILYRIQP